MANLSDFHTQRKNLKRILNFILFPFDFLLSNKLIIFWINYKLRALLININKIINSNLLQ